MAGETGNGMLKKVVCIGEHTIYFMMVSFPIEVCTCQQYT